MANSIMPPDGTFIGIDAPMRFVFTYDPGGLGKKDVPVVFSSDDANITFDPPQIPNNPMITDANSGEAVVMVTYKAPDGNSPAGVSVEIKVEDGAGTSYLTPAPKYTTIQIGTGTLVLSPPSVPVAPSQNELQDPAYMSTATVQFTKFGGGMLKNYPIGFQLLNANVHVYDANGNELQVDKDSTYWFNMGDNGEPVKFKVSSEFEGVYQGSIQYGSGNTVDNDHLIFTPSLAGGVGSQFNVWSPLDLDSFTGASIQASIVDTNLSHSGVQPGDPVVALVNGKVASDVLPCSALATDVQIQKQVFKTGGVENLISWMATTTSGTTIQSKVAHADVNGDLQLHPPQDGELPKPFVTGIGIINIALLLKGDVPIQIPNVPANEDITLVYYLNGWIPGVTPPEAKGASFSQVFAAVAQGGTRQVKVDAHNLGGYAANGATQGTFECYYYFGNGPAPTDKSKYSAPLLPIIPLVTG